MKDIIDDRVPRLGNLCTYIVPVDQLMVDNRSFVVNNAADITDDPVKAHVPDSKFPCICIYFGNTVEQRGSPPTEIICKFYLHLP